MILTVTINPLLEQRLTFEKTIFPGLNRNGKLKLAAGGKGINVSRQLNRLNIQNIALTFVGGTNGKLFRNSINDEGIDFSLINTQSETRICSVIINSSANKASYFFSENQSITKDETEKFIAKMEKMIRNCEMVIFSGSSPCIETDIIFPAGIELANKLDKISICDTYGNHLEDCYSVSPRIVHNNVEEVKISLNVDLRSDKDKTNLLKSLYNKGIKQVFLTDGENNYYASNFDFHYKVRVPKITGIDSTGSGDAFIAGITYGWHNNLVFKDQVKLATALGAANAKVFDVCNIPFGDTFKLVELVKIHPVGKQIKIINDTPD